MWITGTGAMNRDIINNLRKWKNKKRRKPLIVRGARQVGKTWIIKHFAEADFNDYAYFVCDKNNTQLTGIFEASFDTERIITLLEIACSKKIIPGKTLIVFDEIQEIPRALESLKYFCENAPEYHIIAAGSLMGIATHEGTSFPVGKVEEEYMYPLSFSEFLDATGQHQLRQLLESKDTDAIKVFADKFKENLRLYYVIGGMPEAVSVWAEEHDITEARRIQKGLLDFYDNDFSKHAPQSQLVKIRSVWNSILKQLAKENRKFIYGLIRSGSRAKDYEYAINWLYDYGIIRIVRRVSKPGLPLKAYADNDIFKIYMLDTGLMCAMGDLPPGVVLEGNRVFEEFKGALTEQYVCQELVIEHRDNLYYWSADNSSGEVDFIIQNQSGAVPLEVKAEENLKAKSLKAFCDKYGISGVRTSMSDYRSQEKLVNVPLYYIREYLK